MPYIPKKVRKALLKHGSPFTPGELTFMLTQQCIDYKAANYSDHCEVIGALFCTALEYYRRAVAPYEDKKITENGDVYPS